MTGEDLRETPARMARAYAELFDAQPLRLTTFPNDEGYDELVLARAIPFRTVCEHHLLPFSGVAHVGYLPGERILGLSKLARLVEHFAARPQTQERLTKQVADCLAARLSPAGRGRRAGGRAHVHDTARSAGAGQRRPSPRPCWARCAPTRAPGRSSSPWPACRADHDAAARREGEDRNDRRTSGAEQGRRLDLAG